jgi:Protein of unknown function (DUF5656)
MGIVAFVAVRPQQGWILAVSVIAVAVAVEGTIRTNPRWFGGFYDALVFTFLPALAVLSVALFINEAIDGYARVLAALVGGGAVGVLTYGEYQTVSFGTRIYGPMRLVLAIGTYLVAFGLFTVFFSRDLSVPVASIAVGFVSFALAMELLRESRLMGPSSLLAASGVGLALGEFRASLFFFPLDGLLAGALLIIGFYFATGIVHHLLDEDLELSTMSEYVLVAGVGAAAVIVARAFS